MSRNRAFAFTWNNYDEAVVIARFESLQEKTKYLVFGREIGESGTPHLQGTIVFKNAMTLKAVIKKLPGCHVSVCRDVEASILYCKKDDADPYEYGEYAVVGEKLADARAARKAKNLLFAGGDLKALCDDGEFPFNQLATLKRCQQVYLAALPPYRHDIVRGVWFYGPPGTGKSHQARDEYPDAYIKSQNKWFDGYVGQEVILLDDLDSDVMGHYLKIWTDKYPCLGETKNGHVQLQHKVFVVTSNYSPEELFCKDPVMAQAVRRRCAVTHFNRPLC